MEEVKKESFFKKHKSQILKLLFAFLIVIAVSFLFAGLLLLTHVIYIDDGLKFNISLFNNIKNQWWFVILWIFIQVVVTVLLSFVPGTSMMFILGAVALFKDSWQPWQIFLVSFLGVILSSVGMDLVGRFGGAKLARKLIGDDDYEKADQLVKTKGIVYVPIMYLLPVFPDDAICMCCGAIKMKFWLHIIYIVLCRGVGCATIVFGLDLVPFEEFKSIYDWIIFITVVVFWIIVLFFLARKLDKWLTKKLAKKEENSDKQE